MASAPPGRLSDSCRCSGPTQTCGIRDTRGGVPPSGNSDAAEGRISGETELPGRGCVQVSLLQREAALRLHAHWGQSTAPRQVCPQGRRGWERRELPAHCCANPSKALVWSVMCQIQSPRTAKPSVECAFSTSLKHRSNAPGLTSALAGLVLVTARTK